MPGKSPRRLLALVTTGALLTSAAAYTVLRSAPAFAATSADVWLTTPDQVNKLTQKTPVTFGTATGGSVITVNPSTAYQSMVGFGASMTDASAYVINSSSQRNAIMNALFSPTGGIGISWLRQPIGTSDFARAFYSFDDGAADPTLARFSVARDQEYILPLLQQARGLNPQLSVMGSPWSAPGWMKTSGNMVGGGLSSGREGVFADYLVKFVQAYQSAGIPISYLTVANEPQHSPPAYPGMLMSAAQQATIINTLKPKLAAAGLSTKLLVNDHNWDLISFTQQILNATGNNADGVAWHHYGGNVSAQTTVRNQYPSKEVHFTEGSNIDGPDFANLIRTQGAGTAINTIRNWSRTVTFWNVALDQNGGPKIGNGCLCTGLVTVNGGSVTYGAEYYVMGHFSKFVKPGAVRIDSNVSGNVNNVAFRNPDGTIALIAANTGTAAQNIQVSYGGQAFSYSLPAGSMATFTWPGTLVTSPSATPTGTPTASPTVSPTASPTAAPTAAITGVGGKCADVAGASSANGAAIQLYTCNGTTAQRWTVGTDGTVRALGKCMDVAGAGTANGTVVQLYDCNGTNAQRWTRDGTRLRNTGSNRCLNATGNSSADGTRLQIWDCGTATGQQWNLPT